MTFPKIIGITGHIGSGKSTLASFLVKNCGYEEYSFAAPLKEIGKIFGFSEKQLYGSQSDKNEIHSYWGISSRLFLQKMGSEMFRDALPKILPEMNLENSVWIELFIMKILSEKELGKKYVISDVRFLDEARIIKELGGVILKMQRDTDKTGKEFTHKSELEIEKIEAEFIVNNNLEKDIVGQNVKEILENFERNK